MVCYYLSQYLPLCGVASFNNTYDNCYVSMHACAACLQVLPACKLKESLNKACYLYDDNYCAHMHTRTHARMHACTHVHTCTHTCTHTHTHTLTPLDCSSCYGHHSDEQLSKGWILYSRPCILCPSCRGNHWHSEIHPRILDSRLTGIMYFTCFQTYCRSWNFLR